jgi:hypothetical protein
MAFSKHRDPPPKRRPRQADNPPAFVKESVQYARAGIAKERIGNDLLQKAAQTTGRARKMLKTRGENMVREGQAEYNYHMKRVRTGNKLIKARHGHQH